MKDFPPRHATGIFLRDLGEDLNDHWPLLFQPVRAKLPLEIYTDVPMGDMTLQIFSPGQDSYYRKWTWRVHGA